jgi:hypothetical protein
MEYKYEVLSLIWQNEKSLILRELLSYFRLRLTMFLCVLSSCVIRHEEMPNVETIDVDAGFSNRRNR